MNDANSLVHSVWRGLCKVLPLLVTLGWYRRWGAPVEASLVGLVAMVALDLTTVPPVSIIVTAIRMTFATVAMCALSAVIGCIVWFPWNIWLVGPLSLFVPVARDAYLDAANAFFVGSLCVTAGRLIDFGALYRCIGTVAKIESK